MFRLLLKVATKPPRVNHEAGHGVSAGSAHSLSSASQRSLHNAPIFRLLLKVAVNGTHQCDYSNFCGGFGSQPLQARARRQQTHEGPGESERVAPNLHLIKTALKKTALTLNQSDSVHVNTSSTYLLGLLAMIKCSICSYQCDN